MGEADLGFGKDGIGLHSVRSGEAMAMFLYGVSEIIMMRVGRWSSEAFLEYIREQVDSFTLVVAQKMLQFEKFHHLNDKENKLHLDNCRSTCTKEGVGASHIPFTVHYSKGVLEDLLP